MKFCFQDDEETRNSLQTTKLQKTLVEGLNFQSEISLSKIQRKQRESVREYEFEQENLGRIENNLHSLIFSCEKQLQRQKNVQQVLRKEIDLLKKEDKDQSKKVEEQNSAQISKKVQKLEIENKREEQNTKEKYRSKNQQQIQIKENEETYDTKIGRQKCFQDEDKNQNIHNQTSNTNNHITIKQNNTRSIKSQLMSKGYPTIAKSANHNCPIQNKNKLPFRFKNY